MRYEGIEEEDMRDVIRMEGMGTCGMSDRTGKKRYVTTRPVLGWGI